MPTPVATPESEAAAAAAAEDDSRDYGNLLVHPGSFVDPFAGMTVYRRDPKTGRLVADTWDEPVPALDTSFGSLTGPGATGPAAPVTAVPSEVVWTDPSGAITAPPVVDAPAMPAQQPAPATPAATPATATTPAAPATSVTAPTASTPTPAAAEPATPATPAAEPAMPATPAVAPVTTTAPDVDQTAPVATPATPTADSVSQPVDDATATSTPPATSEPVAAPTTTQEPAAEPAASTPPAADAAADPATAEPTNAAAPAPTAAAPAAEPPAAAAANNAAADTAAADPQPSEPADSAETAGDVIAVPATESEVDTQPEDLTVSEHLELDLPAPDNNAVAATAAAGSLFTNTPAGAADNLLSVPAGRAAAIARRNGATPTSDHVQLPAPTRCGKVTSFTCEIPGLCTARDGCACNQRIGTRAADISSTCNCNAANGFHLATDNGVAACAWDVSFGDTKSFEVPRLGTVELPVILGNDACPSSSQRVISAVDLAAAKPVTCPRDANFVRLANRRSNPWGTEMCSKGAGGHYVLRTTLRGTDRGECRMVKVTTTDARSHNLVFKYY
ncbi:hypothetical protein COO60DRAFT_1534387 [Scenedesmus sp. NREL 46B-D3]|nr:hypothetical protein COO60DRAFT_1534387 [Scenedesmus sp. NREL 46B-D3]